MLAPEPGRGVHVVFSGFNGAFRKYFPGLDPTEELRELHEMGVIHLRPAKRGVVISRPKGNGKNHNDEQADEALRKMGLA